MRLLWLFLGASLPLFGMQFLRLDNEAATMHIAVPMFILGLIIVLGILFVLDRGGRVPLFLKNKRMLTLFFILAYLFLTWHMVGALRAGESVRAIKECIKLGLGYLCMFSVITFFPRDIKFLERFWSLAIYTSAILLGYLVYKYAFVFQVTSLGTELSEPSIIGKNLLGSYLTWILPYSIAFVFSSKRNILAIATALVLIIAWIYTGSRGAWIAVLVGMISILPFLGTTYGIKKITYFACGLVALFGLGVWVLSQFFRVESALYYIRFQELIHPEAVVEFHSVENRSSLVTEAFGIFQKAPLIGVGLTKTGILMDLQTHNSHLSVLTDLGLIGLGLFWGILLCIYAMVLRMPSHFSKMEVSWVYFGGLAGFTGSLVFMNTMDRVHTTTQFWVLTGFTLLAASMLKKKEDSATE